MYMYNNVFCLVKASLWGTRAENVTERDYEEMNTHAITSLLTPILSSIDMPDHLRELWGKTNIQLIANNIRNRYVQDNLPITIPYVILKGTAASQYYPKPEYRIMGDIDIMTKREDFDIAYKQLIEDGYHVTKESEREVCFVKNGIIIELHHFFASFNNPKHSKLMDDLILENITPTHILPDLVNGLTLLEHISQHLEHGLGLRQIIDWMMFVDKCLPDSKWLEFEKMAKDLGLCKLAIVTTKMCEIYLGLSTREWCKKADVSTCDHLMDYIMTCGNFGNKWTRDSDIGETVFSYIRRPIAAYKWFQERGLVNWKAAKKHAVLRPFAWVYQMGRYIVKGFEQEGAASALRAEYVAAKKRVNLFELLGVKQRSKGLVVYRKGKYIKK